MAKIKQGILGGFSGSVANVVGSSWKGIAVMKAKPLSVANPKTAAQVAQRNKFKAGSELSTKVKNSIIKPFWDRFAVQMSGVNAWMSKNVKNYDDTGAPDLSKLKFSKGNIGSQQILTADYVPLTQVLSVTWDSGDMPSNGLVTDDMAAVVVGEDNIPYGIREAGIAQRQDDTLDIDCVPGIPGGSVARVYLISKRPDGTIVSNTANKIVSGI